MNSPGKPPVMKAKKKYSGALFLESNEFDCFADEINESGSEENQEDQRIAIQVINSMSRRESSHLQLSAGLGSASRKISKKLDLETFEESDGYSKSASHKAQASEQKENSEIIHGFFPNSTNCMGMNSIPSMPGQAMGFQAQPMAYFPQQPFYMGEMPRDYYQVENPALHEMTNQQLMANFREYATSQMDSKFIQSRIERDKAFFDLVFESLLESFPEFATNIMSSYLCLKVIELSGYDSSRLARIVESLKTKVLMLSMDPCGTRVVQRLIEKIHVLPDLLTQITEEIKDNVCMMIMCNNGNHVIQKLINQVDSEAIDFVYTEILMEFKNIGNHKHGCCVIQRCIDNSNSEQKVVLFY